MNEKLKMTDNNAEVIRMKRKYQWILCAGLIIFVIAAFCVLVSKDNKEEVKGAFVREGGYQSECLYQSARKCMSCASRDKTLDVINLGAEDFIVYYKRKQEESKIFHYGKIVFVILVAFFGASFSIMTYNTDVGIEELFYNVYEMIMGQAPDGPNILHISYTAGLAIGIILFFDHAGKIKLNDDPTPFEVQMRLYERDVNDTLMINAGRKGEEADVDS